MSATIETNADKVYSEFAKLSVKEMRSAIRRGVTKGSQLIRKEARRNLKAKIGRAATNKSRYGDSLSDAIRLTKVNESKAGEIFRLLLITTSRKLRSISFVLRWFEAGTLPRKNRKGYNRGAMKATNFFSNAVSSTESAYRNAVVKEIEATVNKINTKNISK